MKKNLKRLLPIFSFLLIISQASAGPYAPAAGQSGSTAIHMSNGVFTAWATGWVNYNPGTHVDDKWKTPQKALGKAKGDSYDICCLGRGGAITLTFDKRISNGDGWDFAVFENSFSDGFLELAYVEVSADGINFFRFSNRSLTSQPVSAYGTIDPTDVNGLAGKYRQGYGAPFDLTDVGLSSATHVRIVDIIGNGAYFDSKSHVIYDPYPISGSAGFDLDAVGVIHQGASPAEPPSVTTSSAADISMNSAGLCGTVNPNGSSTTYYFQYGLTTVYGSTTGSQNAGNGSTAVSVVAGLTGLTPGNTYHFRIVAQNSAGSSYGLDRSFTTDQPPPSNVIYVVPLGDSGHCGGHYPCKSSIGDAVDYAMNTSLGQQVTINLAVGEYNESIDAVNPNGKTVNVLGGWASDFSGASQANTIMKGGVKTTGGKFVVNKTIIRPK